MCCRVFETWNPEPKSSLLITRAEFPLGRRAFPNANASFHAPKLKLYFLVDFIGVFLLIAQRYGAFGAVAVLELLQLLELVQGFERQQLVQQLWQCPW